MSGSASDFPGRYPVLIGTRAFDVDTSYEAFRRQSQHHDTIPSQRESINLTDVAGEGTLNTEGLWRRGQISWHHGGGQVYLDRKDSDEFRFLYSKGVDIWTQNQLTLLPDTTARVTDGTTYNWCTVAVAGTYIYHLQGNANPGGSVRVRFTTDYSSFTTPTGLPTTNMFYLATNGSQVWVCGNGGVYVTTAGGSSWTQVITDATDHVWWVGDRLIVSVGPKLWDITACTGAAQALAAGVANNFFTHPISTWDWLDATAGESFIYLSGCVNAAAPTVGDSKVYQIQTPAAGTVNLPGCVEALRMEKGEFAGTVYAYENFVFLGTNLGIRCCQTISQYAPSGNAGDLVSGPLIPNLTQPTQAPFQPYIGNFVSGFVGYNRWVWFSWPNYTDDAGTLWWGLGRLDLGTFLADLQPAYASDLMVQSIATSVNSHHTLDWDPVTNGPLIIVPSDESASGWNGGLYTQDYNVSISGATKYVASGTLRSGRITWGIPDYKTVAQANLNTRPKNAVAPFDAAGGSVTLDVAYDGGAFAALSPLAPNQQSNPPTLVTPLTPAEEVEIECILEAGSVSHTDDTRPFLTRWTAKALPNVVSGIYVFVAVKLYTENDIEGSTDFSDPYGDYAYLENLRLAQTIIDYKEASSSAGATQFAVKAVVTELYWMPHKKRDNADGGYEGDLVVTLKSVVG